MENTSREHGVQVTVVNIKYGKELSRKIRNRPEMTILDLPENIVKSSDDEQKYFDSIETFAYNTLTKKYGAELTYCQVYL